jgi:hypothetical protein
VLGMPSRLEDTERTRSRERDVKDIVVRVWERCLGENDKTSNLEKECARLRGLLDKAHDIIRRSSMGPNAEVSGAGTASAGLPGYAAGGNGEQK